MAKEPEVLALKPNKEIEQLLKSFVAKNPCEKCLYELYINKELPDSYILTIYRGEVSFTQDENIHYNQQSLGRITISGKEFKVFSGAEHYFNNERILNEHKEVVFDSFPNNKHIIPIAWTAIDSAGTITIKSYTNVYPFIPLPVEIYAAPISIKEDIKAEKNH